MSPNRKNRHRSCSLPRRHVRASVIDTLRPERNAGGRSSAAQPQETPPAAGAADSGAGQEPAPGSAEALAVLAALGIAPRAWSGDTLGPDDMHFSPLAIGHATHRLVELKQRLDQLTAEQKQLQETLRLAHLRGDLLHLLRPEADGGGYQLTGGVVLHRRSGRRQWRYSPACSELEAQLKARQTYEQASGQASWRLGPAFWELRFAKG